LKLSKNVFYSQYTKNFWLSLVVQEESSSATDVWHPAVGLGLLCLLCTIFPFCEDVPDTSGGLKWL